MRSRTRCGRLIAVAAAVACGEVFVHAPVAAAVEETHEPLTFLYHADLDGRFATPGCGGQPARATPDFANLAGVLAAARAESSARGLPAPIALLGGNLAAPDLMGSALLQRGEAGARTLAALLARGGYGAIALGQHDLSLGQPALKQMVLALGERGMPVVATNLQCDRGRAELCKHVVREVLIQRGSVTVGVLATLSPTTLPGIAVEARAGLSLDDPALAIRRGVKRLRAEGASRVIVLTQGPRDARGLAEIDALQRSLERPAGGPASDEPDLILAGGLEDEDGEGALRLLRRDRAPAVVGSPDGVSGLSRVLLPGSSGDGGDATVEALSVSAAALAPVDVESRALLGPEIAGYCATYEKAVSPAPVRGLLTRDAFVGYALEIMRRRADSEIALINRAAVKRAPFPLSGPVTRGQLHRALPYRAVIGIARVAGGVVDGALGAALSNPKLSAVGLARGNGGLEVNGRPIDKARFYRVATIAFVAAGGDGLVPPDALRWHPLPGEPDLRDTIEAFLRTETSSEDADPTIDARTDFGRPPSALPLVVAFADVGLDVADTRITNAPGYGDAQLARANQQVWKGEATGIVQLRHPAHEDDTRINLKYGFTRTAPIGMPAVSGETTDLITVSSVYNYRGFGHHLSAPRPRMPDPYARLGLESEFTRPDISPTQPRTFHHLELTATAGALVAVTPAFKLRGGGGARRELLASPQDGGHWRPLLEAGGTLSPIALATLGPLAVKLEGIVDYNFVDPGGVREHQVRGSGKLSVPLLPLLFITAGLDFFAVQRQRQGWGVSYDTTVGLRVHLDAAHQWL